jgi:hypothetical protein
LRVDRRSCDKTAVSFGAVIQIVIVLGGAVALGLLVAAHPVLGAS